MLLAHSEARVSFTHFLRFQGVTAITVVITGVITVVITGVTTVTSGPAMVNSPNGGTH